MLHYSTHDNINGFKSKAYSVLFNMKYVLSQTLLLLISAVKPVPVVNGILKSTDTLDQENHIDRIKNYPRDHPSVANVAGLTLIS